MALDQNVQVAHLHFPRSQACLTEDVNVGEIMAMRPERFVAEPFEVSESIPRSGDLLVIAPGGWGDLMFLEPVLRGWRINNPDARLGLTVGTEHHRIFDGLGLNYEPVPYPVPSSMVYSFENNVFCTEMRIQRNPGVHPTDLYADVLGLELQDKRPRYKISLEEAEFAEKELPKTGRPRIGMHVRATALCRTYPHQVPLLETLLSKRKYEVVLFGAHGEAQADDSAELGLVNLCNRPLTFRQSAALLSTCDGFIAPDSGLLHVAGALGVATVALFGPFSWKERTIYYPSVQALQGRARCAPCHYHKRAGREWPEGGPCEQTGHCVALADITPKRIVSQLEAMLEARHLRRLPSWLL
jgi:ADP-heptose:LPS heptosyltransferase